MRTGDVWNGYIIESLIGEGSLGKVYSITRTEGDHKFEAVLKIIELSEEDIDSYLHDQFDTVIEMMHCVRELSGVPYIVPFEDLIIQKGEGGSGCKIYIKEEKLVPMISFLRKNIRSFVI